MGSLGQLGGTNTSIYKPAKVSVHNTAFAMFPRITPQGITDETSDPVFTLEQNEAGIIDAYVYKYNWYSLLS